MWAYLEKKFKDFPAQQMVAKKIIELGLRIGGERIFCGDVEVKDTALAKAVGVDRRVVKATIKTIKDDKELKKLFENIWPAGAFLKNVARYLGYGLVEIEADADRPGILSSAAALIASKNISIKQVHADDPTVIKNPKLTIITEKEIPGNLINEFLKIKGVKKVSIS